MEKDKAYFIRLADLKKVLQFLVASNRDVTVFEIHKATGISAANLAWIVARLDRYGVARADQDLRLGSLVNKQSLFALARVAKLRKIKNTLNYSNQVNPRQGVATDLATLPPTWSIKNVKPKQF